MVDDTHRLANCARRARYLGSVVNGEDSREWNHSLIRILVGGNDKVIVFLKVLMVCFVHLSIGLQVGHSSTRC